MQESISHKYEPASEPLQVIPAYCLSPRVGRYCFFFFITLKPRVE